MYTVSQKNRTLETFSNISQQSWTNINDFLVQRIVNKYATTDA